MTVKQFVTIIGGPAIGALVTLAILLLYKISIESYGVVNMAVTIILFGLAAMIGLDATLKASFLTR
jgi:hypothetical protein